LDSLTPGRGVEELALSTLYDSPKYYELAFSFRDIAAEVSVLEDVIRRFSAIKVERILEVACGNCPHMPELVSRGYSFVGIDLNPTMLAFAREKAAGLAGSVDLIPANLVDFNIDTPVDFAYVMLGSLYVTNTPELVSHFDAVGRALQRGGLYFLDWCIDFDPNTDVSDTWEIDREGIRVKVTFFTKRVNRVEQTLEETATIEVDDGGDKTELMHQAVKRAIYPQEFLAFIESRPDFEFVGWWNNWNLDSPIDGLSPTNRPITVIRRTAM
jgi:SAM-dependent methyltransferase